MSPSRSGAKLFVAFAVLGGAFLVAQPFRTDSSRKVRAVSRTADHVVLRETPAPGDIELLRTEAPTAEIQRTLLAPPPDAAEPPRLKEGAVRLPPPPIMARTYPGSPFGQGSATPSASPHGSRSRTVQRTHEVRDGDTLKSLAQRYLGDRARWQEIFQVNRDRVQEPESLPLATKLVIPPRFPMPSSKSSDARARVVAQAPLVPLTP